MKFWKISYLCVSCRFNAVVSVRIVAASVAAIVVVITVVTVVVGVVDEEVDANVGMAKATIEVLAAAIGSLKRFTALQWPPE